MARVTLQEYCAEARQRIDQRAYDEAIAICRHILQRYPTHVMTYQILGEACLAKGDFEEAEHVFKRLLGQADPENFAAYAGLGAIREEQGKYDEAIWYMERAFELIPNTDQVRQALRRLYRKRDGVEPTRIKLNKAALARLYARGGQYRQAVQELRNLLAKQPYHDRIDLKLSLAETLWRDSQYEQAADTARQVLEICPNCLKAMLLLGQIQMEKGRLEEGKALLNETRRLDPENTVAQAVFDGRSPLPRRIVRIPAIEREAGEAPSPETVQASCAQAEPVAEPEQPTLARQAARDTIPDSGALSPEMPSAAVADVTGTSPEVRLEEDEADVEIERHTEPEPAQVRTGGEDPALRSESEQAIAEGMIAAETISEPEVAAEELRAESELSEEDLLDALPQPDEIGAPQAVVPDDVELANARNSDAALSDVERYRLHLEQMPKDHDTRLLLARAYRDQEQMRLALEQYNRLRHTKRDVLSRAIQDVETIVASRPDNLQAHELLADFYARSGQLQEAVDRYRWILHRLEEETE